MIAVHGSCRPAISSMFNEVSVYTLLDSPLHRSLLHVTVLAGRSIDADVTAIRLNEADHFANTAFVDARRLMLTTREEEKLQTWPVDHQSIFEHLRQQRPPEGTTCLRDKWRPGSPPWRRLYQPIDQHRPVIDSVCLIFPVWGKSWCHLNCSRCGKCPPFNSNQVYLLERLSPSLRRAVLDGYNMESARAEQRRARDPSTARYSHAQLLTKLSRTERQILGYLRSDVTEREVAEAIHRSPHTVHVHVKNIYRKLGVNSRRSLREMF